MASDYEAITLYNVKQLGEDTSSRKSQVNMYSDPTHFVYEILQNADDYSASEISFHLLPDRLIIEHNGIPFKTENVNGISYFGKGTSREDLVKTGHFGLGFKSVFAFTAKPIIYSGDEHFEIYDLYRLRAAAVPNDLHKSRTRIILPFNHMDLKPDYIENYVSSDKAFNEIAKRLKDLNKISLLFTQNIREVKWDAGNERGKYLRTDLSEEKEEYSSIFRKRKTRIADGNTSETYIVFSRLIQWYDPSTRKENKYKPVDIAFRLDDNGKSISKMKHPLVVLFKTKIETHMGFLLNGPYRTTPNRETVNTNDDFNQHLLAETSVLLAETLPKLKDMKLLDINLLTSMPINNEEFSEDNENNMFLPIYKRVKSELYENAFLPGNDGNFIAAKHAKFADGEKLIKLLSEDQLKALLNVDEPQKWLSKEITKDKEKTQILWSYLRFVLNVEEIDPEKFARKITSKYLEKQTDEWMIQFYIYLDWVWKTVNDIIKEQPFIRLNDNSHVIPFQTEGKLNAYIFTSGKSNYPMVKEEITNNGQVLKFLKEKVGIHDVGENEFIESILESYYKQDNICPNLNDNIKHMERFISWYKKGGEVSIFNGSHIFLDKTEQLFCTPEQCFIDVPFKETALSVLYEIETPIEEKSPLWERYKELVGFVDFAISVGVTDKLNIEKIEDSWDNQDNELYKYSSAKHSEYTINEDYIIDELEELLALKNTNINRLIWNTMCEADSEVLIAKYRPNRSYPLQKASSQIIFTLREEKWIPDINGKFCKPSEITQDQLLDDFIYDDENGWLSAIGFGENTHVEDMAFQDKSEAAKVLGIKNLKFIEEIKKFEEDPQLYEKWKSFEAAESKSPDFPEDVPIDSERSRIKMNEKIQDATEKKYAKKNVSQRVTLGTIDQHTFLRDYYTNKDGQMICQICEKEMPFKKRDGQYYFEAIGSYDSKFELEELYLALCPLCAAMFKEFITNGINDEVQKFRSHILESDLEKIPINLDKEGYSIHFKNKHINRLRTIIQREIEETDKKNPVTLLKKVYDKAVKEDGWTRLSDFGSKLKQLYPSFDPETYGFKKLSELIEAYSDIFGLNEHKYKSGTKTLSLRLKE
ncbi:MAG: OST-HTH/LOTUS domain-containing protein [Candidatus Methanoperedens sp.]